MTVSIAAPVPDELSLLCPSILHASVEVAMVTFIIGICEYWGYRALASCSFVV